MEAADTARVEVAVQYKTRSWQTVEIDLGPGEACGVDLVTPAVLGIAEMGLPVTQYVRCISIHEQVAQKLHACTGPQRGGRARDVLDILLLDMLGQLDYRLTREAADAFSRSARPTPFAQCGVSCGVAAGTGSVSAGARLQDDQS
jgi:hypothetical protein